MTKPPRNFFYKVSYKNPSPALPILLATVLSSILGIEIVDDKNPETALPILKTNSLLYYSRMGLFWL
ncbi:MAG TPA: hypothetical protein HPP56_08305, partial [Nitrospirae bacterium]|nr:hypothetical protein [Nitrospirota bacterium]